MRIRQLDVSFGNTDIPQLIDLNDEFANIPNLAGWFDGGIGNYTYDSANNLVLKDKKGISDLSFVTQSGYESPSIVPNGLNGNNTIKFTGKGLKRGVEDAPLIGGLTFLTVFKNDAGIANSNQIMSAYSGTTKGLLIWSRTQLDRISSQAPGGGSINSLTTATEWRLCITSVTSSLTAGASILRMLDVNDFTLITDVTTSANLGTSIHLGSGSTVSTRQIHGEMAEAAIFFDDYLDPANSAGLATILSYCQEKYPAVVV